MSSIIMQNKNFKDQQGNRSWFVTVSDKIDVKCDAAYIHNTIETNRDWMCIYLSDLQTNNITVFSIYEQNIN